MRAILTALVCVVFLNSAWAGSQPKKPSGVEPPKEKARTMPLDPYRKEYKIGVMGFISRSEEDIFGAEKDPKTNKLPKRTEHPAGGGIFWEKFERGSESGELNAKIGIGFVKGKEEDKIGFDTKVEVVFGKPGELNFESAIKANTLGTIENQVSLEGGVGYRGLFPDQEVHLRAVGEIEKIGDRNIDGTALGLAGGFDFRLNCDQDFLIDLGARMGVVWNADADQRPGAKQDGVGTHGKIQAAATFFMGNKKLGEVRPFIRTEVVSDMLMYKLRHSDGTIEDRSPTSVQGFMSTGVAW